MAEASWRAAFTANVVSVGQQVVVLLARLLWFLICLAAELLWKVFCLVYKSISLAVSTWQARHQSTRQLGASANPASSCDSPELPQADPSENGQAPASPREPGAAAGPLAAAQALPSPPPPSDGGVSDQAEGCSVHVSLAAAAAVPVPPSPPASPCAAAPPTAACAVDEAACADADAAPAAAADFAAAAADSSPHEVAQQAPAVDDKVDALLVEPAVAKAVDAEDVPCVEALSAHEPEAGSWCLRVLSSAHTGAAAQLSRAVTEAKKRCPQVRFSIPQAVDGDAGGIAVLGPAGEIQSACADLCSTVGRSRESSLEDVAVQHFFLLRFTLRDVWELPQDDDVADTSVDGDWVDLGGGGASGTRTEDSAVRSRLLEVFSSDRRLHAFMDSDSHIGIGARGVERVDVVGELLPEVWRAASQAVLAAEAHQVYLSRSYDAVFWCPSAMEWRIEDQVSSARSHWKGEKAPVAAHGAGPVGGVGLYGTDLTGFEDLCANIGAVLRGVDPPGWHRLQWTQEGEGSVPYMTY